MVELKTPGEIDAMAAAGAVVARALAATRDATGSGVRLTELDQVAREVLREAGASSPFLAGIAAAQPGARIGDISAAIGKVARDAGYGLHTDFGGHGVGRTMHESPHIPNDGRPGRGMRLQPGLTVAIEPWFLAGGRDAYRIDDDGWTLRSSDGTRGAHFEHTIAITGDGPQILTV